MATVNDARGAALVQRFAARKVALSVWDATSDIGVACFVASIADRADTPHPLPGTFWGAGCHLDPRVAFAAGNEPARDLALARLALSRRRGRVIRGEHFHYRKICSLASPPIMTERRRKIHKKMA